MGGQLLEAEVSELVRPAGAPPGRIRGVSEIREGEVDPVEVEARFDGRPAATAFAETSNPSRSPSPLTGDD